MYVGHVGIALALRSARRAPPLWLLVLAAQGPDWIDAALDVSGYRWRDPSRSPHGWMPVAFGTCVVAGVAAMLPRVTSRAAAGALAAAAYLSHWAADYLTGWKPTWPHGPMVGLRLYGHPTADFVLEAAVVTAGWWLWRGELVPDAASDRAARRSATLLLVILLALQLAADVVMARPWRA